MESHAFSERDLDIVESLLPGALTFTYKVANAADGAALDPKKREQAIELIKKRIAKVRYLRLRKEIFEGQNPEINTDKRAVVSRLEALGLRKEIAEALEEVDKKLISAATPLDFKGCMDLLRTVYEETFEEAAGAVEKKRAKPCPKDGPFKPWREYLEKEGVITRDEGELRQKLYNYLSNAGTHQLGSASEQVRLSRNIVVEVCLLLLGRVQSLLA